jgi:hypothetical protein
MNISLVSSPSEYAKVADTTAWDLDFH